MIEGLGQKEIRFAQRLASNSLKTRNQTLKKLESFLGTIEQPLPDEDFLKLWKGLFYCVWLSDKVKVQQELCARIGKLLHSFSSPLVAFQFLKCFYLTLNREWAGLDHLRLDKFYSLQRRVLEESLRLAVSAERTPSQKDESDSENEKEDSEENETETENQSMYLWSDAIQQGIDEDTAPGIVLHLADIFVPTLVSVLPEGEPSFEIISQDEMNALLYPFYILLQNSTTDRVNQRIIQEVFHGFLRIKSDHKEEEIEYDEEETDEYQRHILNLFLKFPFGCYFSGISEALFGIASDPETQEKNRTKIYKLRETFQAKFALPTAKEDTPAVYKPLTSEEVFSSRQIGKRKRKKKRAPTKNAKKTRYQ